MAFTRGVLQKQKKNHKLKLLYKLKELKKVNITMIKPFRSSYT